MFFNLVVKPILFCFTLGVFRKVKSVHISNHNNNKNNDGFSSKKRETHKRMVNNNNNNNSTQKATITAKLQKLKIQAYKFIW